MNTKNETFTLFYPDRDEIKAAQLACCGRCCNACEAPAEYAWRKRDVDMSLLLEKAIGLELTEAERSAVTLHWFEGESLSLISRKKGISPAAVKRTLDRAQEKLEKALGYVVCYQQNIMSESIIPVVVGKARVIAAARNASGESTGDRIVRLRQSQCLSLEALSEALGIGVARLIKIERGAELQGAELVALSEFFNITADYILKGVKNDRNEKLA